MELVESGRILYQRRWLVAVAFVLAVVIGVLVAFRVGSVVPPQLHSRSYTVGEASAQVLIDTHRSQISDVSPPGATNLYARASLLADLLATAPVEQQLTRQLGLTPGELAVTPPPDSIIAPIKATALATAGQGVAHGAPSWTLAVTLDPNLPLINLDAVAPSPQKAVQLANSAIAVLNQEVASVAASQRIRPTSRVVVDTIGPPVGTPVARGLRKIDGAAAALVVFLVACFGLVLTGGARRRRATGTELARVSRDEPANVRNGDPRFGDGQANGWAVRTDGTTSSRRFRVLNVGAGAQVTGDPDAEQSAHPS